MSNSVRARVEQELFLRAFMPVNPSSRAVAQMIELMRDLDYEPGEVLFHEGMIASHLYFVVDGRVELRAEGKEPWVFGEGSVLGIVDAMRERPYARTAVAVRPTHVIAQAFTDYMDVLEDNFDLALQTLRLAVTQNEHLEEGLKEHLRKAGDAGSRAYGSALGSGDESTLGRLLSLRATPTFAGSPVQALARLAHLAGVNRVAAGTRLFAAGERIDVIYVLTHGRVEEGSPAREIGPVTLLGGLHAVSHVSHRFDAHVTVDATLLALQKDDLFDVMEDHFGLVRALFAGVAAERETLLLLAAAEGQTPPRTV